MKKRVVYKFRIICWWRVLCFMIKPKHKRDSKHGGSIVSYISSYKTWIYSTCFSEKVHFVNDKHAPGWLNDVDHYIVLDWFEYTDKWTNDCFRILRYHLWPSIFLYIARGQMQTKIYVCWPGNASFKYIDMIGEFYDKSVPYKILQQL